MREIKNMEIKNEKRKHRKNLLIVLVIISIILILSVINSIYNKYKRDEYYELKGYQTAVATCIQENSYIKGITR